MLKNLKARLLSMCFLSHLYFPISSHHNRTDEMRPEWFSLSISDDRGGLPPVPWDKMWDTDYYWFPLLRDRRPFVGRADFDKDESGAFKPRRWWYGTIH